MRTAILGLALILGAPAHASGVQIFSCVQHGVKIYSDTPCHSTDFDQDAPKPTQQKKPPEPPRLVTGQGESS